MSRQGGARALPRFRTGQVLIRMADEHDIPALLRYLSENQEHFRPFEPLKPAGYYTEAFWRDQVRRSLQEFYADQSVRLFLFRVEEGADRGPVVGSMNFTQIARGPMQACSLGYGLDPREQGKGIMTEAVRAVIPYLFGELNLHRIMAGYMPHNERSARVLQRLGFVVEGLAKDYIRIEGQWRDHVLTSLVNPGWKEP